MSEDRKLPDGFTLKSVTTKAGGFEYTLEVPQATSLQAILDGYRELEPDKNPEEIVLAVWNASNEQGAKQSPKESVRKALDQYPADSEEVREAVGKAQQTAKLFIQGAPRSGGGFGTRHESGLTKKQREAFGTALATEMVKTGKPPSPSRQREIMVELGIDPDSFAA